jgi:hypothetical protein
MINGERERKRKRDYLVRELDDLFRVCLDGGLGLRQVRYVYDLYLTDHQRLRGQSCTVSKNVARSVRGGRNISKPIQRERERERIENQ